MHSRLFPVQSTIFVLITLVMVACHREPYSIKDNVIARNVSDQFFFGPALMVAPVFEYGTRQRAVYLPESTLSL